MVERGGALGTTQRRLEARERIERLEAHGFVRIVAQRRDLFRQRRVAAREQRVAAV